MRARVVKPVVGPPEFVRFNYRSRATLNNLSGREDMRHKSERKRREERASVLLDFFTHSGVTVATLKKGGWKRALVPRKYLCSERRLFYGDFGLV